MTTNTMDNLHEATLLSGIDPNTTIENALNSFNGNYRKFLLNYKDIAGEPVDNVMIVKRSNATIVLFRDITGNNALVIFPFATYGYNLHCGRKTFLSLIEN